ncbi:chlorophyll a/b-binding protein [Nodosilinea sp. AN01ver1]|uniref:chlorophyll a/b-binding protein n=1 Tax=Nodosilinea sp. AN01ver1 TaxID=3423362 RepID=UPI003D311553
MTSDPASSAQLDPNATAAAEPAPAFGWTRYAERINGRFAMVGFVALLLLELVTGQTFFSWLGLR